MSEEQQIPEPRTFTQEEVNKFLADDRRKHKTQNEKLIGQLEELKTSQGLSVAEKSSLEQRIEELQSANMTKEELAKKEKDKLTKGYRKDLESLTSERDNWKVRYTNSTIQRAIIDSAVSNEAFSPNQLVAILQSNTRLVEDLGDDGKPNGNFITKVKFNDIDKDGNPIVLDISVNDAVKRMKEIPEQYGNLFKSGASGGLGLRTESQQSSDTPDFTNSAQYREWRKKNKDFQLD